MQALHKKFSQGKSFRAGGIEFESRSPPFACRLVCVKRSPISNASMTVFRYPLLLAAAAEQGEIKVMKLVLLGVGVVSVTVVLAAQIGSAQAPSTVKVLGCLQGDGSEGKPWILAGTALPPPPPPVAPAAQAGGRGDGARGGAAAGGGRGGGAPGGGAPAGGGRGGRGGGGRGGAAAAPAPPPQPVEIIDLRLTGGMDLTPWRNMRIEVEGTLGAKPATGLQELNVTFARSVQGVCTPK